MKNLLSKPLLYSFTIALLFFSCKKEEVDYEGKSAPENVKKSLSFEKINSGISFAEYVAFANVNPNDYLLIQSHTSPIPQPPVYQMLNAKTGTTSPYSISINNSIYTFDDYVINSNVAYGRLDPAEIPNLYGENLAFSFSNNTITATSSENGSIYIPESINWSGGIGLSYASYGPGDVLTWNADQNNSNGVVISLEYLPSEQSNLAIAQAQPRHIYRGINVPDNGSFLLRAEYFDDIPDGASLNAWIGRVGKGFISTNNPNDFSLAVVSESGFSAKLTMNGQ